jgi:hypothetical protein
MHRSFVSTTALPVNDFAHQHEMGAGPSSTGSRATRAFGVDDGALSVAENRLYDVLRCIADRRLVLAFEADAVSLREVYPTMWLICQ